MRWFHLSVFVQMTFYIQNMPSILIQVLDLILFHTQANFLMFLNLISDFDLHAKSFPLLSPC